MNAPINRIIEWAERFIKQNDSAMAIILMRDTPEAKSAGIDNISPSWKRAEDIVTAKSMVASLKNSI